MPTSFPLPIECLHLIVKQLVVDNDIGTITTLLRVSKVTCLTTLPFIYENSFHWLGCKLRALRYTRSIETRMSTLVRLFLRSIPDESCSDLVRAVYDYKPGPPSQHWPINYLSFVRHFQSQDSETKSLLTNTLLTQSGPRRPLNPVMEAYVTRHDLVAKYDALALGQEHDRFRRLVQDWRQSALTLTYLEVDIFREVSWTLCASILEQLQSIVIPLSDIGRYLENVDRFHSLTSVTFKMDELGFFENNRLESLNDEDLLKAHQWMEKRRQDLESAVQFVQHHTATFRGTLKEVLVPTDYSWCFHRQFCPATYLTRMLDLVPSLIDLRELVQENVPQFVTKAETTNIDKLHTIDILELDNQWYQKLRSTSFLHRCHSLRRCSMMTLGPDTFKWAVQKDFRNGQQEIHLPSLEELSIWPTTIPLHTELIDIGLGFGNTLKVVKIQGSIGVPDPFLPFNPFRVGQGWRMPCLTTLIVKASMERVLVDRELLNHCPLLKTLSLSDAPGATVLSHEVHMCNTAHLTALTHLQLGGRPGMTFHPDTLHSTKKLTMLVLGGSDVFDRLPLPSFREYLEESVAHGLFTASEEEEGSRQMESPPAKWTWDWDLPNLVHLDIGIEFGNRFQFQMLAKTPNLRELTLSLFSRTFVADRALSVHNFLVRQLSNKEEKEEVDKGLTQQDTERNPHGEGTSTSEQMPLDAQLCNLSADTLESILSYLWPFPSATSLKSDAISSSIPPLNGLEGSHPRAVAGHRLDVMGQVLMHAYYRTGHQDDYFSPRYAGCAPVYEQSQKQASEQERLVKAQTIMALVQDDAAMQARLEVLLKQYKLYERRRQQGARDLLEEIPEGMTLITVPSLRKLDLYGHWVIPEPLLRIMFGHVFRNVCTLAVFGCQGHSMDALVRETQKMPHLEVVTVLGQRGPDPVSEECKLKRYDGWPISPFEPARVRYRFPELCEQDEQTYICDIGSSI